MTDETPNQHRHTYEIARLDDVQCPECGDREHITEMKAAEGSQPLPPEQRATCNKCGHSNHPLAFYRERKWEAMSDEECETARQQQARYQGGYCAWQESAAGIAERREP